MSSSPWNLSRTKESKEPFEEAGKLVYQEAFSRMVWPGFRPAISSDLSPPIIMEDDMALKGLDIIEEAVYAVDQEIRLLIPETRIRPGPGQDPAGFISCRKLFRPPFGRRNSSRERIARSASSVLDSWAKTHTYGYKTIPLYYSNLPFKIKLVGICDSVQGGRGTMRKRTNGFRIRDHRIRTISSTARISTIVDICTPNIYHKGAVLQGAAARQERPTATSRSLVSYEETKEITQMSWTSYDAI